MFRITIVFGGSNKERLVSVATAQALNAALPAADLWFWDADDTLHGSSAAALQAHQRPFEDAFHADGAPLGTLAQALDRAKVESRVLVLGLHGGNAENGELQAMCEARGVAFTGSGSAASHLAFDKVVAKKFAALAGVRITANVTLANIEGDFDTHGSLIAKPVRDGSSYGLLFVHAKQDIAAVLSAARTEDYLIEPFVTGTEATCGVLEQSDGSLIALPPVEIIAADGSFDYTAKYLLKSTQEICPGRFAPDITSAICDQAVKAHRALSCRGYSRSDFIVGKDGPVYLETNTLPGLTKASLYPKALAAHGIAFRDFLRGQIELAQHRADGPPGLA